MKSKTLRYFVTILTVWVAAPIFLAIVIPTTVLADTVTEKGTAYCNSQYPIGKAKPELGVNCVYGYIQGYKYPNDKGGFCFKIAKKVLSGSPTSKQITSSDVYKACANGKVKGKNQRADDDKASPSTPASQTSNHYCGSGDDKVGTYFDLGCSGKDPKKGGDANPIIALLLTALSWMTGLVALAVVGGIIYGGILYTSAQDNASQTQKGITFIINSVLGLVLWIAAYALINFIVPGGLFN